MCPPALTSPNSSSFASKASFSEDNGYRCSEGALYFRDSRERVRVRFDEALRSKALAAVHGLRLVAAGGRIPPPLGVDVGATGLDKYGTNGPRFGLLAGRKDLVGRIRVKGFEFGMEARQMLYPAVVRTLEQYDPSRVRALIATTQQIAGEFRPLLGNRLRETPTTVQIAADDILEIALERGGVQKAPVVPYEASAALSMLLLRDHGMLMVHFVGVPPGTADLLIKFVPPETLERFGGAGKYADAVDASLTRLGELHREPESIRGLLLGKN
jgi:L-seryl-tRNA(Ser) seleniumtransferase